ncbi:MAG TPA: sigma-70 family RNA polymerase sigma factor [Anaerolineales bacterium]|nr:sigma-70 family RNA polymerase sigma factor [Anaerolineales bacterium]
MESEINLLNAARTMDPDALVKIFDRYAPIVFKYALRLCGDPVLSDHIVGDVFVNLLDQFSLGSGPKSNLRSYLFQTALHLVINEVRYSHTRTPLETATALAKDKRATDRSLESRLLYKHVLRVIQNELTDDQRYVITLRFFEGLSIRATAAITGKTIANVKVIQNRAITAMQRSIA